MAAVDHSPRRVITLTPSGHPDLAFVIAALMNGSTRLGAPAHLVTDRGGVFISPAFKAFLDEWRVRPHEGRLGQRGSIAVTECLIESFKYEWLRRVLRVRSAGHLAELCSSFAYWYNDWRPHQSLAGARPADVYRCGVLMKPPGTGLRREAKAIPSNIENTHFAATQTTGWRLKAAA